MSSNASFPPTRNLPLNLNLESANSFLTAYRGFLFAHSRRAFFFDHRDSRLERERWVWKEQRGLWGTQSRPWQRWKEEGVEGVEGSGGG